MRLATDAGELPLLYAVTVFGSPRDVTLDEITIETFFPADAATRAALHALAGGQSLQRNDDGGSNARAVETLPCRRNDS